MNTNLKKLLLVTQIAPHVVLSHLGRVQFHHFNPTSQTMKINHTRANQGVNTHTSQVELNSIEIFKTQYTKNYTQIVLCMLEEYLSLLASGEETLKFTTPIRQTIFNAYETALKALLGLEDTVTLTYENAWDRYNLHVNERFFLLEKRETKTVVKDSMGSTYTIDNEDCQITQGELSKESKSLWTKLIKEYKED